MKTLAVLLSLLAALTMPAGAALAQRGGHGGGHGGGGGGGGGHHGGPGGPPGGGGHHGGGGYHGGGGHYGGHGAHGTVIIGGPWWWGGGPWWWGAYGYPYAYPYPYPYPYAYAYYGGGAYPSDDPGGAPVYIQRPSASSARPEGYWYYCASVRAYYPTVDTCPEEWTLVPPVAE